MKRLLFVVVFLAAIPVVLGQPAPPMNIYGNVTENSTGAVGKSVEFRDSGEVIASDTTDVNGFYDVYIPFSQDYSDGNVTGYIEGTRFGVFGFRQGESFRRDIDGEFKAPVVSGITEDETNTTVLIEWSTDEPSITEIVYGRDTPVSEESENTGNLTKDHRINITGLQPGTTYVFQIRTRDSAGNERVFDRSGSYYSFETDGQKPEEESRGSQGASGSGQKSSGNQAGNTSSQDEQLQPSEQPQKFPVRLEEGQQTDIGFIQAGENGVVKIQDFSSLEGFTFRSSEVIESSSVSIEEMDSVPSGIESPGETYSVADIGFSAPESDIREALVNFSVGRAWVSSLSGTVEDVRVKRFNSGSWNTLETKYSGIRDDRYIFSATTPGFSYFAVVMEDSENLIKLRSVNASNLEGEVPYNVVITGSVENTAQKNVNRTLKVYLGDVPAKSREFSLEPGERKDFEISLRIEEPGKREIAVSGHVFEVDAEGSGLPAFLGIGVLLLLTSIGSITVYEYYRGEFSPKELFSDSVREKARIEVEDGKFQFKGSEKEEGSEKDVRGRVTLTVGFDDGEPSLKERRIFRSIDQQMDYDWEHMIEKNLEGVEEELSQRIREFVKEVKEQNTDEKVCSICMEDFDTEDALHIHQSISHDIRCSVCGKSFETVRALHIHQGMKHGEISHDLYD